MRILCIVLAFGCLLHSIALADTDEGGYLAFDCSFDATDGEAPNVAISLSGEDQVSLKINGSGVAGGFIPSTTSPAPTIGFFASGAGGGVYTLAIHRSFFRPHPDGYDPTRPPATLTVQWTDKDVTPVVEVFSGHCLIED